MTSEEQPVVDVEVIAAVLHRAIETGEVGELGRVFADDATVWHNSDRLELDKEAALARIAGAVAVLDDIHVEVVRRAATTFGFVEQVVLHGRAKSSGGAVALHNCLVVEATDGRVIRIDEYVDPTVASQLGGTAEPPT